jgi:hypothetical protein
LVQRKLQCWGEMNMEIPNATPDHLVWCLPVLLRAGFHDFRSTRHPNISPVLPGITQSSVCAYLGMYRQRAHERTLG